MIYRINKKGLLDRISLWNSFIKKKVHLIACGGTSLTLLGVKDTTKDIDLIIPDLAEYEYLLKILTQLGYKAAGGSGWTRGDGFIFDLFKGKYVHSTELLESPLDKENHILMKEFSNIYLGILNYYDIIITKLFRGDSIDIDDCLSLIKNKGTEINRDQLIKRFRETASYDVSEIKINKNLDYFLKLLKEKGVKLC